MLGTPSLGHTRSKSPGRAEPSRSRDVHQRERESSKKSSKSSRKYYSSEEDSESETESESDSGSDRHYSSRRHTSHREERESKSKSSKSSKYRDDSPPKRSSKTKDESPPRRSSKYKEESPPKSSKKSSKKYYSESESESTSESEVEVKRKKDRSRKSESEKYAELKYAEAKAKESKAKERLKKDEKKFVETKVKESKSSKGSKKLPGKFSSGSDSESKSESDSESESGSGSDKSGSESEDSHRRAKIKSKVYESELVKNRELLKKLQLKTAEDKKKAEEYAKETAKIGRGRDAVVKLDVVEKNELVRIPSNPIAVAPKGALLLAGPTGNRARSTSRGRNVEIDIGYGVLEDELKIQRRPIPRSGPLEIAPKGSSLALGRGGIVHKRSTSRAREVDVDVGYGALSSEYIIQRRGLPQSGPVEIAPKGSHLGVGRSGATVRPALAVESSSNGHSRRLSVAGQGPLAITVGEAPPGSPLLEGYRGTYQSISPMPSPLLIASTAPHDIDVLSLELAGVGPPRFAAQQRVRIYDPARDALALKEAITRSKPDYDVLSDILPGLAHENILALRTEYKKYVKVSNKGVNIAKHIKLKVPGNIGKAAYAIALGRWESEAHWANFWYQSGSSRRELLIESLIGRSNSEVIHIKEAFSDKRYNDSLDKCMQTELKQDKFRYAVLTALAAKRMDEHTSISAVKVQEDTVKLHSALVARDGGETAMMDIILLRSDAHLREVLKTFEVKYSANFAREMIKKSQNLVGETLMHILNGIINRPVRDALLLKQAMTENTQQRAELLISRLVRYHWEPWHFEKVKIEYAKRYGMSLKDSVSRTAQGEFGDFLVEIVESTNKF